MELSEASLSVVHKAQFRQFRGMTYIYTHIHTYPKGSLMVLHKAPQNHEFFLQVDALKTWASKKGQWDLC